MCVKDTVTIVLSLPNKGKTSCFKSIFQVIIIHPLSLQLKSVFFSFCLSVKCPKRHLHGSFAKEIKDIFIQGREKNKRNWIFILFCLLCSVGRHISVHRIWHSVNSPKNIQRCLSIQFSSSRRF